MNLNFKTLPNQISLVDRVISAEEINKFFGVNLPCDFIEFWRSFSEIIFENGIYIYGFNIAKEKNIQYEIQKYAPEFLLIGDDSGGQGIFIETNSEQLNIYYLGLGALGSLPMNSLEVRLFDWLRNNPTIDNKETDDADILDYVDVFVTKTPKDISRFILDARRAFNLSVSIKEIKDGLNNLPYLIKENIILMKYDNTIKELNDLHNCVETAKNKTDHH